MSITKVDGTVTHVGMCLSVSTWWNSSMDVTSYYVHVYDPISREFEKIYVCDDFDSRPQATYTIDATDEVKAIWEAKQAAIRAQERAMVELREVMTPAKGKRLEVFKGRKVAKGTTGECFWIGQSAYGTRVGIKDDAGNVHWTSVDNVQVV